MSQESLASADFVFNEAGNFNVSVVVENRPVKRQESQLDVCTVMVQVSVERPNAFSGCGL